MRAPNEASLRAQTPKLSASCTPFVSACSAKSSHVPQCLLFRLACVRAPNEASLRAQTPKLIASCASFVSACSAKISHVPLRLLFRLTCYARQTRRPCGRKTQILQAALRSFPQVFLLIRLRVHEASIKLLSAFFAKIIYFLHFFVNRGILSMLPLFKYEKHNRIFFRLRGTLNMQKA